MVQINDRSGPRILDKITITMVIRLRKDHQKRGELMRKRSTLTAEIAAKIKRLATENRYFQHEIAAIVGVNQGRVSEVLTGKRFAEVRPH